MFVCMYVQIKTFRIPLKVRNIVGLLSVDVCKVCGLVFGIHTFRMHVAIRPWCITQPACVNLLRDSPKLAQTKY